MTQAYDRIIATITTASDASQVVKAMVKSTEWRKGTSGTWNSTDCTLTAGNVYQFRTPLSGMSSSTTAILPNIKASVIVDWDTTATAITSVGDYFMRNYAYRCFSLTSLSVPDTSGLTSVGSYFMYNYARDCSSLTSLSVPDTSGLTTVGDSFMRNYAYYCSSLTSLLLPSKTGWFASHNINWYVPSARLGYLKGYAPNSTAQTAWQALTVSGKTLYINYIQSEDDVEVTPGGSNDYTLTCAAGSYSLTGTDADLVLLRNYILACEAGGYALTGTNAGLTSARTMACNAGSYTLTGTNADLYRSLVMACEVWRATVVMARRVSKTVTMNRRVTDTYDELENL